MRAVDQVVGEQPHPGVAQVGLDDGGPAGHLGLPAQRLELAAQLADQVREPGEVGLHRSSLRSAFSLRLRCLRTPAASSMKPRRSSGVACRTESSWPWPTMTCISRPMPESDSSSWTSSSRHAVAVDGVLGAAVAEHRPRDRDLGVVDRQRAVGVVDGEHAPRRGPAAGGRRCRRR